MEQYNKIRQKKALLKNWSCIYHVPLCFTKVEHSGTKWNIVEHKKAQNGLRLTNNKHKKIKCLLAK